MRVSRDLRDRSAIAPQGDTKPLSHPRGHNAKGIPRRISIGESALTRSSKLLKMINFGQVLMIEDTNPNNRVIFRGPNPTRNFVP